jgi:hypothetical protein
MAYTFLWIVRVFIRFNVFRSAGFIPRRMIETSIAPQIARSLKTQILTFIEFVNKFENDGQDSGFSLMNNANLTRKKIGQAFEILKTQIEIFDRVEATGKEEYYPQNKREFHSRLKKFLGLTKNVYVQDRRNSGANRSLWSILVGIDNFNMSNFSLIILKIFLR